MTVLRAFELWVALCEVARNHTDEQTVRKDDRFQQTSSAFLTAAHTLSHQEQFELQDRMHGFGCPFALRYYEQKVLFDFPWWQPAASTEPQLTFPQPDKSEPPAGDLAAAYAANIKSYGLMDAAYNAARENSRAAALATFTALKEQFLEADFDTVHQAAQRALRLHLAATDLAQKIWARTLPYEKAEEILTRQFSEFPAPTRQKALSYAYADAR